MNDVVWLSIVQKIPVGPGIYWDTALLEELLKDCNFHNEIGELKEAIVVIPGAYAGRHITRINKELKKLDKCKVIITSDEDSKFPIDKLSHPNMELFANYYHKKYKSKITWLPIGPAKIPRYPYTDKDLNWFFAGQVREHPSREKLVKRLKKIRMGKLIESKGFAQGIPQDEYYQFMARAKAVPAPAGNVSPDSFRFYEALELGAVPISENPKYWSHLFNDMPIPTLTSWKELEKEILYIADNLGHRNNCVAWWQRKKLEIKDKILGDKPVITVLIPVSPIRSHPSTAILDETIASVREQLPNARIILTFDGVRAEQQDLHDSYQEFIARVLWRYNNQNIYPMIFQDHTHQVGMAREAIKAINSPLLLYVEQDTPLTGDIAWHKCIVRILDGYYDVVRFHFEAVIPEPHKHMMLGEQSGFMRTYQWSQRPHLASVSFYDRILKTCFSVRAKSFIEDKMHGVCENYYLEHGMTGWYNYRLAIYHPEGDIKRSYHTDGRAGEKKYDESQIF